MPDSPAIRSRTFTIPKAGVAQSENEDAAAVAQVQWPIRAAVADGATESIYSRRWAEIVAHGLCERPLNREALSSGISAWREVWRNGLPHPEQEPSWFVEAKVREGAYASTLGVEFSADGGWHAVAIGDCVLFHIRGDDLLAAWPYTGCNEFPARPSLLQSRSVGEEGLGTDVRWTEGRWTAGDSFLLTTDAVAKWLLANEETGAKMEDGWAAPAAVPAWDRGDYRQAVSGARAADRLANDDSTIVVLEFVDDSEDG